MLPKESLKNISSRTGVYLFKNKEEIIYIGKALNLKERVKSYFYRKDSLKNNRLISEITAVESIEVGSEIEALILEANLIKKYQPKYNSLLKDDRSYLYIEITAEEFPRILTGRKKSASVPAGHQYGPFPNASAVRHVLKILRKIFPYCTQSAKAIRPCFYSYIKLCNPCPAVIKKSANFKVYKNIYRKNIKYIQSILEGNIVTLKAELQKKLNNAIQKLKFEEAQIISSQINNINYICTPRLHLSNFLTDPNFLYKDKINTLKQLRDLLKTYFPRITKLKRIEGIDVSNISGKQATGSLVVFIDGQKQLSLYRRFKLKSKGPNDVLMIAEITHRRFAHKEWEYPDLLIVDGGIPQVSQILKYLKLNRINFTNVIGLAKQAEKIIIPYQNNYKVIFLSRNTKILQLIQEIRDEAHRFAKKYHQLIRKKTLIEISSNN